MPERGRECVKEALDGFAEKLFAKIYFVCALTPELSRTAARNGGVVHVTMQPSREAVSA